MESCDEGGPHEAALQLCEGGEPEGVVAGWMALEERSLVEEAKNVQDTGELSELLARVSLRERDVQAELEQGATSQHASLSRELHAVHSSSSEVDEALADALSARDALAASSHLAENLCSNLRSLHSSRLNLLAALDAVSSSLHCAGSLQSALSSIRDGSYAHAADQIAEFDRLGHDSADPSQLQQMRQAKSQLQRICVDKITELSEAGETDGVLEYARLLPKVSMAQDAVSYLSSYIRSSVSSAAKEQYDILIQSLSSAHDHGHLQRQQSGESSSSPFIACLGASLAAAIEAIEYCESFVHEHFGASSLLSILVDVQHEVDSRVSQVVRKYQDHHSMQRISREISAASEGAEEGPDPRRIERYLQDILGISQKSEEYMLAMLDKISACASSSDGASGHYAAGTESAGLSSSADHSQHNQQHLQQQQQQGMHSLSTARNAVRTGNLSRTVQELVAHYIGLEEYYMTRSVSKAIKMDKVEGERLISSMVDDAFYILHASCMRATATSSLQSACAIYTNATNLLSNDLWKALQKKMHSSGTRIGNAFPGAGSDDDDLQHSRASVAEDFAAINNLEMASSYVSKLRQELEARAFSEFAKANERERARSCLAEMQQASVSFQQACSESVDELAGEAVKQTSIALEVLPSMKYELTEQELTRNEAENPWQAGLTASVTAFGEWVRPSLVQGCYDSMVQSVADLLAAKLESHIMTKRFNQLGGLELDREVRSLASGVATLTERPVRERFARLLQLSTVLNAEGMQEVLDYWSAGSSSSSVAWRLSPSDVKAALSLRSDFHREEVARVRLQ